MIDWLRVADLRMEIGDEAFGEVVALFLEETDEVILRLPKLQTLSDVARDLHFLKGSALNLGLNGLAALTSEGERQALALLRTAGGAGGSGAFDAGTVDLARIVTCYGSSKMALLHRIGRAAA